MCKTASADGEKTIVTAEDIVFREGHEKADSKGGHSTLGSTNSYAYSVGNGKFSVKFWDNVVSACRTSSNGSIWVAVHWSARSHVKSESSGGAIITCIAGGSVDPDICRWDDVVKGKTSVFCTSVVNEGTLAFGGYTVGLAVAVVYNNVEVSV